jgi:hypothetical protein
VKPLARALASARVMRVLELIFSRVPLLAALFFAVTRFNRRVAVICISRDDTDLVATGYDYLRRMGIRLHVFLDGSSAEASKADLEAMGIPFASLQANPARHVEALVETVSRQIESEWMLRLDNDELVNVHGLIETAIRTLLDDGTECFAIRRSWVLLRDGVPHVGESDFIGPDHQWRLFRHRRVRFHGRIHTPAFDPPDRAAYLSASSRLYHFDWVVRPEAYRREKVRFYATRAVDEPLLPSEPDVARERLKLARWYLPEDIDELELVPMRDPAAQKAASRFKEIAEAA